MESGIEEFDQTAQHNFVASEAGWYRFEGELILEDGGVRISNCKFFETYKEAQEYLKEERE